MAESQIAIPIPYDEITAFCERHHIRKLSLFGSVLRDDFNDASDIDVLVEFEEGTSATLFDMGHIQIELAELLQRDVDLKTQKFLSQRIREKVLPNVVTLYQR